MKTRAENLRLFIEARELRDTIKDVLHTKAINSSKNPTTSPPTEVIDYMQYKKTHNSS